MKRNRIGLTLWMASVPVALCAEEPLSAIEWLKEPAPITVAQPLIAPIGQPNDQPGQGAIVPDVDVQPLDGAQTDAVGLLPQSVTGLPSGIWQASTTDALVSRLDRLPDAPLPAIQALFYTLLLAEADPPEDVAQNARFLRARVAALRKYGAIEAALALVERAGPTQAPLFDDWMELSLLKGREDEACTALSQDPSLSQSYATRIFCLARAGDWQTAALTYETARATNLINDLEAELLAAFLDPEVPVDLSASNAPRDMAPLVFRLYEAAGTPLPTRRLAREYAVADLRGTMGWRSEIEAAERLARTGALPANRLLGLYTARRPAASGGVWDRARAIQKFDSAMLAQDREKIAEQLPKIWQAMQKEGLGIAFATLYGERLARLDLPDHTDLSQEIALLSPVYEAAAAKQGLQTRHARFLEGLAQGTPDAALAATPTETAIAAAFAATQAPPDFARELAEGELGKVILDAASQLEAAGAAQTQQIEESLALLRFVGLEDVARRAALQILLLPDR